MLSSSQIKDALCGEMYREHVKVEKHFFIIGVQLHFDSASFNQSNKNHQIYPISLRILNLPKSIRNKFEFYIPLAIFYGADKPPLEIMEEIIEESFKSKFDFFIFFNNIFRISFI